MVDLKYSERYNMDIQAKIDNSIRDFIKACKLANYQISLLDIEANYLQAPHSPSKLPKGRMAVYIFIYESEILKIGLVGPKSNARYSSQHYNPNSSQSNLAKSILKDSKFADNINEDNINSWMKTNLTRVNILISEDKGMPMLRFLEAFLHLIFNPRYER